MLQRIIPALSEHSMPFSKDLKPIILRLHEATKEDRVNWCGQHGEMSVIFFLAHLCVCGSTQMTKRKKE